MNNKITKLISAICVICGLTFAQNLTFTPENLNFGNITIAQDSSIQMVLGNSGAELINITDINSNYDVITVNMTNFPVYPGASMPVTVTYAPTPEQGEGIINGLLTFTTDENTETTYNYEVVGNAIANPIITINESALQFDIFVGEDTLNTQTITITNSGYVTAILNFAVIIPPAPLLVSPGDGADLAEYPTLQWGEISSAIAYNVQLATDEMFTELLVDETLPDISYPTSDLPDGTYYWRVKAQNDAGWGEFSEVWSFTFIYPWQCGEDVLVDANGYEYETVQIGDQCWMAENLKVTHYRNGDAIPTGYSNSEWTNLSTGAYSVYDNNESNADTYGYLYNWYAVDDTRNIAPEGWHIPTDEEWMELEMVLGMSESEANSTGWRGTDEGGKLKETGTSHWLSPNSATNESGFTALPGGYRSYSNGNSNGMGTNGYFWSSTVFGDGSAWTRALHFSSSEVDRYATNKRRGSAIRLLRD